MAKSAAVDSVRGECYKLAYVTQAAFLLHSSPYSRGMWMRMLANLHDDRGFDVSSDVEQGLRTPAEAFNHHYAWRMRDLALQFYTVGGDAPVFTGDSDPLIGTLRRLDHLLQALKGRDDIIIVESTDDLDRVIRGERKGLVLTIEGGAPIGASSDLSLLHAMYRLGLRSVNLLWFPSNALGDGLGEPRQAGLTGFGREIVREMSRIGLLPDVSQCSVKSFWDIIEESEVPVIASHSNATACCPHPRNLDNSMLRALAESGGLVGLNGFGAMVTEDPSAATVDKLLDHAVHIIETIGVDHVTFGLNIIPDAVNNARLTRTNQQKHSSHERSARASQHLEGLEDVTGLGRIVDRLAARGLSEHQVEKIAFGNIERVVRCALECEGL